jgi:hypothetical protein
VTSRIVSETARASPSAGQLCDVVQYCIHFESGLPGPPGDPGSCLICMKSSTWRPSARRAEARRVLGPPCAVFVYL